MVAFNFMTLAIDPGPKLSGFVVVDESNGTILKFGKISLKEIKLLQSEFKIDRLLIEITDFPIAMAGESFRDTNIIIGRIIEFYKCACIQIGRKEAINYFKLKDDTGVRHYLKSLGVKLKTDSWQAYLIYHYYKSIG